MFIRLLFLMLAGSVPLYAVPNSPSGEWTWVSRQNFDIKARNKNKRKESLIFAQDSTAPFTQLIVSWNAFRPQSGYFSFYVQVRNAATKAWGTWHHMVDWGVGVQRSFESKSDGFSSYVHVRLETDDKKEADGFRVKVEPHQSASLSLVHGLSAAYSNFNIFKPQPHKNIDQDYASVHLSDMPSIAQFALDHEDKGRMCSPVSCSMVAHYLTGMYKNPLSFAVGSFDVGLGVYGSWPCNTAHAFDSCEGKARFFVRRMNNFKELHQQLAQGLPVIVSVRGSLPGALKPFPHGHLMVVMGWDSQARHVLCHDPAAESDLLVFKRYPLEDFLRAWECSHRLSYVAEQVLPLVASKKL